MPGRSRPWRTSVSWTKSLISWPRKPSGTSMLMKLNYLRSKSRKRLRRRRCRRKSWWLSWNRNTSCSRRTFRRLRWRSTQSLSLLTIYLIYQSRCRLKISRRSQWWMTQYILSKRITSRIKKRWKSNTRRIVRCSKSANKRLICSPVCSIKIKSI